ncbi:UDP-glucose/GDP-mannose dehydrogenase family protein [Desulfothermus okinawensis JCM 13304]
MNLCVIGLGKLGLCTACCFARADYKVYGIDINEDLIANINKKQIPFFEPDLEKLLKEVYHNLFISSEFDVGVLNSDVIFIIVPTPSNTDGSFSNKYILKVFDSIGPIIKKRKDYTVIVIVSTVMPLAGEQELIPHLEHVTGKKIGKDFGYVYNPEFIAIGSVIRDFLNPDIVLVGEYDNRSGDIIEAIYKKVCDNSPYIARTSIINAEVAKLSINCFCTMKISFANFLGELLSEIPKANAREITTIIGQDSRIGTKYISPGLGFGGPCFPRDNEAFINFASRYGKKAVLQKAVVEINRMQPKRAVEKILKEINKINSKVTVSLLGLAYKPNTYLTERSQQVEVAKALLSCDKIHQLKVYDPLVDLNLGWDKCQSLEECVKNSDVIAILTPYPQFLDTNSWKSLLKPNAKIVNFW